MVARSARESRAKVQGERIGSVPYLGSHPYLSSILGSHTRGLPSSDDDKGLSMHIGSSPSLECFPQCGSGIGLASATGVLVAHQSASPPPLERPTEGAETGSLKRLAWGRQPRPRVLMICIHLSPSFSSFLRIWTHHLPSMANCVSLPWIASCTAPEATEVADKSCNASFSARQIGRTPASYQKSEVLSPKRPCNSRQGLSTTSPFSSSHPGRR